MKVMFCFVFYIKNTQLSTGSASHCSAVLELSTFSTLSIALFPLPLFSHCDQKKFFCTGAPPSNLPSRKPAQTHTQTRTVLPPTHTHKSTFYPPPHAYALTTGHTSGGLRAQPSAAHPAHLPPLQYPPFQHMQPLPWVRWQGHWPWPWPRDRGEGAHM